MADAWRKYKHAIAEKRTGKKKAPSNDILKKEEIVIQRLMVWSRKPTTVEFLIDKEPIGEGGFREAFKATSKPQGFQGRDWVLKKYLQSAENTIAETNQTVEQHTMKVVQMHTLAKNFASQLKKS